MLRWPAGYAGRLCRTPQGVGGHGSQRAGCAAPAQRGAGQGQAQDWDRLRLQAVCRAASARPTGSTSWCLSCTLTGSMGLLPRSAHMSGAAQPKLTSHLTPPMLLAPFDFLCYVSAHQPEGVRGAATCDEMQWLPTVTPIAIPVTGAPRRRAADGPRRRRGRARGGRSCAAPRGCRLPHARLPEPRCNINMHIFK